MASALGTFGGHSIASLRPTFCSLLPQAPSGIHGLLPGSSGLEASQSPTEGATGSRIQIALGHSVWPQTAWLPAPAWESPNELWSEECDCGKPNALGQQGWAGVGEGQMAETPAAASHDTSQNPTRCPHSSVPTCHLSPPSLPLPIITPHLSQEAFPKGKLPKSCSALLTYRAARWLPRHPGGSSFGRVRPWPPEVRGTLLATQLTSSCLGSLVLERPMLSKVRNAELSVAGAGSGPGT